MRRRRPRSGLVATLLTPSLAVIVGGLACLAVVGALAALVPQLATYEPRDEGGPD